jgi:hypothetical protein
METTARAPDGLVRSHLDESLDLRPRANGAAARVDWRVCWPVAGLYRNACTAGVRENMQQGTALEYNSESLNCGSERWYFVRNLWTGHHGFVREGAISC